MNVSFGLAFVAGLASFLSPCVLPLVPSYLAFVSGMSLSELGEARVAGRVSHATAHALAFVAGFSLVFITLGAVATTFGTVLVHALPWMQRIGGLLVALFGLQLLGVLRLPFLMREQRVHLATRPAGLAGSAVVGIAFGAGWTPCVGPVLATILLYAGMSSTVAHGTLLLATYALGLGIPFVLFAFAFDRSLVAMRAARRWVRPLERISGALLLIVGITLATGQFQALTAMLAGMGQLFDISPQ